MQTKKPARHLEPNPTRKQKETIKASQKGLKSKDIDIIVEADTLGKFKSQHEVVKNQRPKKYEIKLEGFDIDVHLAHWSELGLPATYIYEHAISVDGFKVPQKEILLIPGVTIFQHYV